MTASEQIASREVEELRRELGRLRAELREETELRRRLVLALGLEESTDVAILRAVEWRRRDLLAPSLTTLIEQAPDEVDAVTAVLAKTSQHTPEMTWGYLQQLEHLIHGLLEARLGHGALVWAYQLLQRFGERGRDPVARAAERGARSPGPVATRLEQRAAVLTRLAASLRRKGAAMAWGNGEGINRLRDLRDVGIHLVTKTRAGRLGHRLKRGVEPVASMYFNAPINADCDLYALGVQTAPKERTDES